MAKDQSLKPACIGVGKLFGHNYVAHYDVVHGPAKFDSRLTSLAGPASAIEKLRPYTKTYVGSVCTRCGHVIHRPED